MKIIVTGGAGFLGARLIEALLENGVNGVPVSRVTSLDLAPCPVADARVVSEINSVTDRDSLDRLVTPDTAAVIHLAAVVSGQAEADFDIGMRVNVDGTRNLLDACRASGARAFFFFSSSLAVFGADCPPVVGDSQVLRPQSSYGAQKAIGELLVADYTRKDYIRGVTGRLPTVVIRPGKPNAAASSFASSILREPINGEPAVCSVKPDLPLWVSSPETVIRNIIALMSSDKNPAPGRTSVNLPGITVTPAEMIAALRDRFGDATADLVTIAPDPAVEAIVGSWPSRFDTVDARERGLTGDTDAAGLIAQYVRDYT